MKRAPFVIAGTLVGVVAALAYHPSQTSSAATVASAPLHPGQPAAQKTTRVPSTTTTKAPTATNRSSSTSSASTPTTSKATGATKPAPTPTASAPVASAPVASTPAATKAASGTKTVAGQVVDTRWGPVQVQVTVSNGKITDITPLQYPNDNPRSSDINYQALPMLAQQALAAQSANIQGVGGATYTSEGYIQSLQSALDQIAAG